MHTLPKNFYNPLPTAHQTLLLKACLLDNGQAVQYWEKWMLVKGFRDLTSQPSNGILPQVYDRLDFASQRLLALLYKKMSAAGVNHPLVTALKGYYRYIWVRNQLLKDELKNIAETFNAQGIKHIVIKGFPMTEVYYKDLGVRSVLDLDIMIHHDSWHQALKILSENRWVSKEAQYTPEAVTHSLHHATHLVKDQFEIDLHIRFHDFPLTENTVESFWKEAITYKPGHKMLRPEHQFISALIHGYDLGGDTILRAIVDTTYIIQNTPGFDWKLVLEVIQQNNLHIPAKVLLEYLNNEGICPIPEYALAALQNYSLTNKEARYFNLLTTPDVGNGYKLLKLRLLQLGLVKVSIFEKVKILINTYKYQWGASSLFTLAYRTTLVMIDKFKSPEKSVVTRKF
ncbi:nucleotidyltransferase family protein [Ohtaekwangia kribbensis]|jgi:hypothetical protein|uniref:Nucleotidyltransferase family protein n=1 Tax=Ohtaekwangia kribbensis TaxID=688913 RepID=A0ABW3K7Z2_9BACT